MICFLVLYVQMWSDAPLSRTDHISGFRNLNIRIYNLFVFCDLPFGASRSVAV